MAEDLMNFDLPPDKSGVIKVIGVGGGGGNAVNHMFEQGITDVDFLICNTDAQALSNSKIPIKIQLGETLTQGRGAGNKPEQGKQAAIESLDKITEVLSHNTKMVFITAGMGGGTGTGAAPVIAEESKDLGILTVGIVTLPFRFEGKRRMNQAIEGLNEMRNHVDSLLVINNEKLREIHGDLPISQAFGRADNVLTVAAKGIAEIITIHGSVNVDFADVQTVMSNSGVSLMGSAMASGENRSVDAIEEALTSPLLNSNDIKGAKNILLNISSGPDDEVRMDEIGIITDYVQEAAGMNADIIWGNTLDQNLGDKICITIIATGFGTDSIPELMVRNAESIISHSLKNIEDTQPSISKNKPIIESDVPFEVIDKGINEDSNAVPSDEPEDEVEHFELLSDSSVSKPSSPFQLDLNISSFDAKATVKLDKVEAPKISYNNESDLDEIENQPAYIRKNIKLDNVESDDTEREVSRFTLNDKDGETKINKDNSFLFDTVD